MAKARTLSPLALDNDTQTQVIMYSTAGKDFGVPLFKLNTQLLKDKLAILQADQGRWLLNSAVDEEYLRQLSSEHKTLVKGKERWQKKSVGLPNHRLDQEVYSLAGAEILRVDLLVPPAQAAEQAAQEEETERPDQDDEGPNWLGNHKGWL